MTMAISAFYLFAVVAAAGVLTTALLLADRPVPAIFGPVHGFGGLLGLGLLLLGILHGSASPTPVPAQAWAALAILAIGFLGGFVFFRVHHRDSTPIALVAGHAALLLIGLATLYPVAFLPPSPIPILSP